MSADTLSTVFQSERLSYRAFENNDDDKKFVSTYIDNDPTVAAFAHAALLKPRNKQSGEALSDIIFKSTMSVMVQISKPVDNGENSAPTPIGVVVLGHGGGNLDQVHNRCIEFGILLAKPYQNQGYGQEATNWALDWAFRFGGFHRVQLHTMSHNERALHVYKKLGFVEEGRAREAMWHDRKWYDMVIFGILEREWAALRGLTDS